MQKVTYFIDLEGELVNSSQRGCEVTSVDVDYSWAWLPDIVVRDYFPVSGSIKAGVSGSTKKK